jgi:DNA polymerase-3 subunit delta
MVAPSAASLAKFLASPPQQISGFIFYGPDALQISARAEAIVQALVKRNGPDGEIIRLHDSDISANPDRLIIELATPPLFGGRKTVWLTSLPAKIQAPLLEVIDEPFAGGDLVVQAPDMKKSHKAVQAFEAAAWLAAIGCYGEDIASIAAMLRQQFSAAGYEIDAEALALIAARSDFSALIAQSEAEKLMTYAGTARKITLGDVEACLADQQSAGFQEIADAALEGHGRESLLAFERLMASEQNVTPVLVVLSSSLQRLQVLRSALDSGASIAQAIKDIRPPVFFKQQNALAAQARAWPLDALKSYLKRLNDTVRDTRLKPALAEAFTRELLLSIAKTGRNLRRQ